MEEKINKQIKILERRIERYEDKIQNQIERIKDTVNSMDAYNIINFVPTDIKRLSDYQNELKCMTEQKEALEFLLEE